MTQGLEEDTLHNTILAERLLSSLDTPCSPHRMRRSQGFSRTPNSNCPVLGTRQVPGQCAGMGSPGKQRSHSSRRADSVALGGTLGAAQEGTSLSPPQFPLKISKGVQIGRDTTGSGICIFRV